MSILRPKFTTSGYFSKKRKGSKKKSKSINLNDSAAENEDNLDQAKNNPVGKKGFKGSKIFNFLKIAKDLRSKKSQASKQSKGNYLGYKDISIDQSTSPELVIKSSENKIILGQEVAPISAKELKSTEKEDSPSDAVKDSGVEEVRVGADENVLASEETAEEVMPAVKSSVKLKNEALNSPTKPSTDVVTKDSSNDGLDLEMASTSNQEMDWWGEISDLDRLNVLAAPIEERVRVLSAKVSLSLEETVKEISERSKVPLVEEIHLSDNSTKLIPIRLIHNFCCLPTINSTEEIVELVTTWPPSDRMSRWVFAVSGKKPVWKLGMPEKVVHAMTENFGIGADSLDDSDFDLEEEEEQKDDIEDQNAAIIRFVNEVIQRAIVDRATDIHFEPHKETLQIRYRIDGQLVPVRVPDNLRSFQDAIISRIKIMSAINISEKRRPQGGRITFTLGQSDLDIRVSTLPTLYGESISLRLLNEKSQPLSMRELGLQGADENKIVSVLEKPHGIVLVTGPTGSGKSTSLTAFIRKIHKPERRIMTVEDPVEYEVSGVNQTQVNSEIGFSFASALREILRQDPDVIMVGEIRDRETADIAIRASLTGHLVLSTLHTNDAPGAITRLIDMDIEPFLIASSVEMVIAQRLVRRLCMSCATPANLSDEDLRASLSLLEIDPKEVIHSEKVLSAVGCNKCQNLGFRGRVGIFELMRMNDDIHGLIIKSASAPEIREVALTQGMTTLQESGWAQIKRGLTSLSEVVRYADIFIDEAQNDHSL